MKNIINWKVFFLLLVLAIVSVICILPYVLTLQADVLKKLGTSVPLLIVAQVFQSIILFAIAIFFGLLFTKKIGFQMRLFEAIVQKGNYKKILKNITGISILIGATTAIAIYVLDSVFSLLGVGITTHQSYAPVWQKLLAAMYGGITEEIVMRLFLMTFFIWVGMKVFKQKKPSVTIIFISIIFTAVIFGLGHLPITASVTQINSMVILRAVVLNGIAGILFGLLFWKKGLESAMIAHFTGDIFLLTLLPLIFK